MQYVLVYLLLINALGFALMLTDKKKAVRKQWRIPEATLISVALLGGSFGCIAGMRLFHHKTKKPAFSIGLPIIFCIQVIGLLILHLVKTTL